MNTMASIFLEPTLPLPIIIGCGLVFAFLAWKTYRDCALRPRERWLLWSLRMAAFLLLAWIMTQASWRSTKTEWEPPVIAIVADTSASMIDNPLQAKENRAERAREFLLSNAWRQVSKNCRLQYFSMGNELQEHNSASEWNFTAARSMLTPALHDLANRLRAENLAAIVVLSDGLDQSGQSLDQLLLPAPVLAPELEDPGTMTETDVEDFAVTDLGYPRRVIVNWEATITAAIQRRSGKVAQTFPVHLKENGAVTQTQIINFAEKERFQKAVFNIKPEEIGSKLYEVSIEPELDSDKNNNLKELIIEVTDAKRRVLYLEGTARWEFKFLKRSLLAEKNLQLSAYVRAGDGTFLNFDEQNTGLAVAASDKLLDKDNLRQFRAVILGDLPGNAFQERDAEELRAFVENGGGLLFLGSKSAYGVQGLAQHQAFRQMLPVSSASDALMREGHFAVDFTPAGRTLPVFSAIAEETRFPPLLSIWGPVQPDAFATIYLAAADSNPVLVGRRFGQGRTAIILSESLWRWQMGSSQGDDGKGLYGRFITQLLHWLGPEQDDSEQDNLLHIMLANAEVHQHETVAIGALAGQATPGSTLTCQIQTPANKHYSLPMLPSRLGSEVGLQQPQNGYRCDFVPEETGSYRIQVFTPDGSQQATTLLLARQPEKERTGQLINRNYLRQLAEISGGKCLPWHQADKLWQGLQPEPRAITVSKEKTLWNHWLGLTVLITLFCLEWWLRRKWELV